MSGLGWALALAAGVIGAATVARLCRMVGTRCHQMSDRGASTASAKRPAPTGPVLVVALTLSMLVLGTGPTAMFAIAAAGTWIAVRRQAATRRRRERDAAVPELVDLFVLAASAGLPVATALPVVTARAPVAVREPIARAVGRMGRGGTAAEAIEQLRFTLGPRAIPLLDALDSASRTGTPLVPALAAVSVAAHHQRTQAAEEAARRLPVTLLFPLACCILPAAVLLALVPVLVASLGSLDP